MKKIIPILITSFISMTLFLLGNSEKILISGYIAKAVFSPYYSVISIVPRFRNLRKENERLHKELAELAYLNMQLEEAKIKNEELRRLLDFREHSIEEMVAAEVISLNLDRFGNSIVINKGKNSKINYNNPVVTYKGIIGKVIEVLPEKAVVQLLYDRNCRVSVQVKRTRTVGILVWEKGIYLNMNGVPLYSDVKVGDEIIASGLGGIFPKGYNVGTVYSIDTEPTGLFLEVLVEPAVNFSALEEVVVIVGEK